jgi:hypothetical protein
VNLIIMERALVKALFDVADDRLLPSVRRTFRFSDDGVGVCFEAN